MHKLTKVLAATTMGGAMALTPAGIATAQPEQDGLVNVFVSDVVIQAPVALAANLCDTNVNVLAQQRRNGGAQCDAQASSDAVFQGSERQPGNVEQDGLVNVAIRDVTVQLPIAVAANVCDTNVNILARQERTGGARCNAVADSNAETMPA